MKRTGAKTLLLGLVVLIMITTIFTGLPVRLPPWDEMACDRVAFSCGAEFEDRFYETMIWNTPEVPDTDERGTRFMELISRMEHYGIPYYGTFRYDMEISESGDNLTVSGYLLYGLQQEASNGFRYTTWYGGFPRQELRVDIEEFYDEGESEPRNYTVMTDRDGYFTINLPLDIDRQCFELTVLYEGKNIIPKNTWAAAQIYAPTGGIETECEYEKLIEKTDQRWWLWLFGIVALGLLGSILFRVIRRNRVGFASDIIPGVQETDDRIMKEPDEPEAGGDILRVAIQFSDIEPYLPAVWGVGDRVTVTVQVRDEKSGTENGVECLLDTGDSTTYTEKTDGNGMAHFYHDYAVTGSYRLLVTYQDKPSGGIVSSWRRLRIVEYRKEMVLLFNDMIRRMNLSAIEIPPKMTPRETEQLLRSRIDGVSAATIRRIVDGFEGANYSTHPVERASYIRMYVAVREVITNGRRSKQDN